MLILDQQKTDSKKEKLVNRLFNDNSIHKYILGRNENVKILSEVIEVDAYIDDYTDEKIFLDKAIIKSIDAEKNSIVVSCSLAIYPHSALETLKKCGIENILDYLEVAKYSNNSLLTIPFLDKAGVDLEINLKKYEYIYSRMLEEESKQVFTDLLNFRKNKDLSYLEGYVVDPVGQYFEDFLNLQEGEVFIDAGGYDGSTSLEFIKHCPNYKSIYIFEPSEENLQMAKENLKNYQNINFISKGLSNKNEVLKFDTNSGSASSISETGSVEIVVDMLDNLVEEKVTFIKMDIEGAEGSAIEGMKNHILNGHPKMAISVYHKADDFWKIPEQILAIRDDCDNYLRHYTEGTDETVMFFMPRG